MEIIRGINRTRMAVAAMIATNGVETLARRTIIAVAMARDERHRSTTTAIDTTVQMSISAINTRSASGMGFKMGLVPRMVSTTPKMGRKVRRQRTRTKRKNTAKRRRRKSTNSNRLVAVAAAAAPKVHRKHPKWTQRIVRSARN